jgi:hypothetical protein
VCVCVCELLACHDFDTGYKLKNEFIVQCEEMRQIIMRGGIPVGSTASTAAAAVSVDPLHDRQLLLSMIQDLEGKITSANQIGGVCHPDTSEIHKLRTELDAELQNRLKLERRYVHMICLVHDCANAIIFDLFRALCLTIIMMSHDTTAF